ncbi:hypothetical protein GCM10009543_26940 [Leifsonia naganoensis]
MTKNDRSAAADAAQTLHAVFGELLWLADWVDKNLPRGAETIYREFPKHPSGVGLLWTADGEYIDIPDKVERDRSRRSSHLRRGGPTDSCPGLHRRKQVGLLGSSKPTNSQTFVTISRCCTTRTVSEPRSRALHRLAWATFPALTV